MCGRGVHVHVSCARDEQRVWRNGARCMSKPDTCHAGHIKLLQLELDGCDVADVLSAASDTEVGVLRVLRRLGAPRVSVSHCNL